MSNYVTDLDDTLIMSNDEPRADLLAYFQQAIADGDRLIVVSGRRIDTFDTVKRWLADNGLQVADADIHLDDFPENSPVIDFKVYKAKQLLDDGVEIEEWFENDRATREALAALGIEMVNPADWTPPTDSVDAEEMPRALPDVPAYMRRAAEQGLRYYADGLAGDGVVAATVREARDMAKGIVTADKWQRIAAWIARHRIDWELVDRNNDASNPDFPGAGAVAAYLWGVDPTDRRSADKVMSYAKAAVDAAATERIDGGMSDESRAASGAADLPIGDRATAWDGVAAEGRVRAWAGGADNMDWERYGRAFFWVDDANPELFGSYKLQFADIVDGELTAMPRGIFAVGAILAGSRGGVDLPAGDRPDVEAKVAAWYDKLATEFDDPNIKAPFQRTAPLSTVYRMLLLQGKLAK